MNGTTHSSTDSLFPASLISPAVAAALPEAYTIRPLQRGDYAAGFLDVLRVLTTVGDVPQADFEARFDEMKQTGNGAVGTHVLVILDGEGKVVGTGALLVERKLYVHMLHLPLHLNMQSARPMLTTATHSIHNLGLVGHIEDIAVAKDQQGKKLGLRIIQALDYVAENVGCYKTILDCSEANEGFYVKCGFKRAGLEMAHYYEKK
jgi:glucosamine-phosphate N-acetyltransferase